MRFMMVKQDGSIRRLDLPLPAPETGLAGHVSFEHAAVVAYPTVTEVLAACGQAEDALEKHILETLMRIYARPTIRALSLYQSATNCMLHKPP